MKFLLIVFILFGLTSGCRVNSQTKDLILTATPENPGWLILKKEDLSNGTYHTNHSEIFGKYVRGL